MTHSAILITHGTDTLAWTHAAVRYAVKNNMANIAITGSQIPMPDGVQFHSLYENIIIQIKSNLKSKFAIWRNG